MSEQGKKPFLCGVHSNVDKLEDLEGMAHALARRRSRSPADVDDLVQEQLVAVWKVAESGWTGERPWRMAKTVMQRTVAGYYNRQRSPVYVALSEDMRASDQTDLLSESDYFDALEASCGKTARKVAENLVAVRDPEVIQYIMELVGRKQAKKQLDAIAGRLANGSTLIGEARKLGFQNGRLLRAMLQEHLGVEGYAAVVTKGFTATDRRHAAPKMAQRPRGAQDRVRISNRTIRDALKMKGNEWRVVLAKIRAFTKEWLSD